MNTEVELQELKINKMSQAKYNALKSQGLINANELYVTTTSNLDADSMTVTNVATPVNVTDAANKSYVDTHCFVLIDLGNGRYEYAQAIMSDASQRTYPRSQA